MFRYEPESKPLDGYTIKRAIQRGGFGEVYYALSDAGKEVALKLVQDNADVELRGVAQCLNLKHPNLLSIHDVKQNDKGEYWVVMEYVSGKTLDAIIAEHPNGMPTELAAEHLKGITDGVHYLHDRGLVHRDLKPANIFVEDGYVKIGDVGLAKFISSSQRSDHTQSVGTVYYMAPEIAHGKYGKEIDIYATGVILFEMLTGKVPFDGESTGEILMKQLSQEPDLTVLPSELRSVLKKALEKDPLKRTATIKELASEFETAIGGTAVAQAAPPQRAREGTFKKKEYQSGRRLNDEGRGRRLNDPPPAPSDAPTQAYEPPNLGKQQGADSDKESPQYRTEHRRLQEASAVNEVAWYQQPEFWWRSVLLFMVMLAFAKFNLPVVILLGIPLSIAYGYFCVSSEARPMNPEAAEEYEQEALAKAEESQSAAGRIYSRARRLNTRYVRNQSPESKRNLSTIQRAAEATGSMSLATIIGGAIAAGLWFTGMFDTPKANQAAVVFGVGTILSAWAAIGCGKVWEGRGGDGVARRLMTGLAGVAVGVCVFFMDHSLMLKLPVEDTGSLSKFMADKQIFGATFSSQDYQRAVGFMAFFGVLLLVRRWWHHVDSYRDQRLSFITVGVTAGVAGLLATIGKFDLQWALLWGASASATAQLASVWAAHETRQQSKPKV